MHMPIFFLLFFQVLSKIEKHHDQNRTSKQMLARTFAEYIIWDTVHGGFGQSRDAQERAKLVKLMLDNHAALADAVRTHTTLGARASRAGIAPEQVVTSSPEQRNNDAQRSGPEGQVTLNAIMDEGMAMVKQLGNGNEALQVNM